MAPQVPLRLDSTATPAAELLRLILAQGVQELRAGHPPRPEHVEAIKYTLAQGHQPPVATIESPERFTFASGPPEGWRAYFPEDGEPTLRRIADGARTIIFDRRGRAKLSDATSGFSGPDTDAIHEFAYDFLPGAFNRILDSDSIELLAPGEDFCAPSGPPGFKTSVVRLDGSKRAGFSAWSIAFAVRSLLDAYAKTNLSVGGTLFGPNKAVFHRCAPGGRVQELDGPPLAVAADAPRTVDVIVRCAEPTPDDAWRAGSGILKKHAPHPALFEGLLLATLREHFDCVEIASGPLLNIHWESPRAKGYNRRLLIYSKPAHVDAWREAIRDVLWSDDAAPIGDLDWPETEVIGNATGKWPQPAVIRFLRPPDQMAKRKGGAK